MSGATSVAQEADGLVTGADELAGGTQSAAVAGGSPRLGAADTLASSASQTNSGAQSLSGGLTKAAKESPTYSKRVSRMPSPRWSVSR